MLRAQSREVIPATTADTNWNYFELGNVFSASCEVRQF